MTVDLKTALAGPDGEAPSGYFQLSRTGTYSFLISVPLLLMYEVLIWMVNKGDAVQVRIGAELWIKNIFESIGLSGRIWQIVLVVIVGVVIMMVDRKRKPKIVARHFGLMLVESLVYAFVLGFLVAFVVGAIFQMIPPAIDQHSFMTQLALSLGAGLYEELFFRVLLVGGFFMLLDWLFLRPEADGEGRRIAVYIVVAVAGAFAFSSVHYIGSLGDAFTLSSFIFRFLFGLALNIVFLVRGFGIAAWTHALYDVTIVLSLWG